MEVKEQEITMTREAADLSKSAIEAVLSGERKDIYPISIISCRPDNQAVPFFERLGVADLVYVFVNEDLVDTYKKKYPDVHVIAREKYKQPGDFDGIEFCPGGARVLSFRGMFDMGFKRFISSDDDLVDLFASVPCDSSDKRYKSRRVPAEYCKKLGLDHSFCALAAGCRLADKMFDECEEAAMGTPLYSGFYNNHDTTVVKAPGSLFVNSDFFFVDSEHMKKMLELIDMSNPLDIELLHIYEDHLYMMLEYCCGMRHFVLPNMCKNKSTSNETANIGTDNESRTDSTLSELMPRIKADPRFGHLFENGLIRVQKAKGKTLNDDWAYFTTHNTKSFYKKTLGKDVQVFSLIDYYKQYDGSRHDLSEVFSSNRCKLNVKIS